MKATINGITIEGSPQEIMEYQRMQAEKAAFKPMPGDVRYPYWPQEPWKVVKSPSVVDDGSILGIPKITCAAGKMGRCSGPCYCTGECEGKGHIDVRPYYEKAREISANM